MPRLLRCCALMPAALLLSINVLAQDRATLSGRLLDEKGKGIPFASVAAVGTSSGTSADSLGHYLLSVPAGQRVRLSFSHINYEGQFIDIELQAGDSRTIDRILKLRDNIVTEVLIADEGNRTGTMQRIDPRMALIIPTSGGGIEALLKTFPGVSSNNELSSQYNVRGGNFDENLIYVNDVEIYRPFLVRSGQQEGLSFINPDLVEGLSFSAGGFEARYGDKMASVLDVQYRRPRGFAGTASGSLLGGSLHLEGSTKDYRFSWLGGVRYRSNQYVLSSLDTDGQYRPEFIDAQGLLNYDINQRWSISFLGNYSMNKYLFVPETRETEFGTISEALRLTVFFDGQELNSFEAMTGALTVEHRPTDRLRLKLIASGYRANENETFDVQGQYWLGQLDNSLGSDNLGEVAFNRGIGTFLNHARNYLTANVLSLRHMGKWQQGYRNLEWGLRYTHERIQDQLNEWNMIDSAGYSIPQTSEGLVVQDVLKTQIGLNSNRIMGFAQNTWFFSDTSRHSLTVGARFHYWDVNQQFFVTPRANYAFNPRWKKADMVFRLSGGMYFQPPFYRELRDMNGQLNTSLKAQESYHAVLGTDYNFRWWGRPFKLIAEVYYKYMDNLVPYEIDNVRLRYYATNNSQGYATGIDLKLNGEFVPGIESWASLSVMTVQEDIKDDFYYRYFNSDGEEIRMGMVNATPVDSLRFEPGYIPRPTDQRVNFSLFFQDYVPRLPQFKMHLNLVFGTGLPFGPPTFERYKDTLRIPPYRRVDIGFSYQLKSDKKELSAKNPFRYIKSAWVSFEVFNLLGTNNTLSYLWISDISNRKFAVPNYLTSRQANLKLIVRF